MFPGIPAEYKEIMAEESGKIDKNKRMEHHESVSCMAGYNRRMLMSPT